jgi:hypothetical protein
MKYLLRALLFLPFGLLAGCCANDTCGCDDLLADSLYFQFDTTQFQASDIDTVYLARYSTTDSTRAIDSVQLTRSQLSRNASLLAVREQVPKGYNTDGSIIILSNNAPFSPTTTGGKLSQYTYRLSVPQGDSRYGPLGKPQPRTMYGYRFGPIVIQGQYKADGCCTCYANTRKTVVVSSNFSALRRTFFDATENSGAGGTGGQPVPIVLHR